MFLGKQELPREKHLSYIIPVIAKERVYTGHVISGKCVAAILYFHKIFIRLNLTFLSLPQIYLKIFLVYIFQANPWMKFSNINSNF